MTLVTDDALSDAITDEFGSPLGLFTHYDSYAANTRAAIRNLGHIDLRVFESQALTTPSTVFHMSTFTVGALNGTTMTNLQQVQTVMAAESWTTGVVAPRSVWENQRALAIALSSTGTITSSSVDTARPVDLTAGFDDSTPLCVSLPSFPASSLNLAASFLDLTSDPTGAFSAGTTASIAFSSSLVPLINGNSQLSVTRGSITGTDLSKITGVRFRLAVTTATGTFYCTAIRLLPAAWSYGKYDIDTRYGRLRRTGPRTGQYDAVRDFDWPINWRAADPPGADDPRFIDGEIGTIFNTGSMSSTNSFTLYFRELTEDFLTQLDLDGSTQAALNGRVQPDVGDAQYNERFQTDLEPFDQTALEGQDMFSLEREADFLSALWIQFVCQWSSTGASVQIVDTEGNGYNVPVIGLTANTNYVFFASLEENGARATIYTLDGAGNIGTRIFDSSKINDDTSYKRRPGRFGWSVALTDGDAWIDSIRQRALSFGEYRSLALTSNTPVVGAELFTVGAPPLEHFESLAPGPYNTTTTQIARDTSNTITAEGSWQVTNIGIDALQGVQSNTFLISDFDQSEIAFDIYYPQSALDANVIPKAFLFEPNTQRIVELLMPPIKGNQWQHVRVKFPFGQSVLTGSYRFLLVQPSPFATTWWVDGLSIFSRGIAWDGRSVVSDPWGSNDARWTSFENVINRDGGGVLFARRGNQLQVRGRALRQGATVDSVRVKPRYAELGRFKPVGYTRPVFPIGAALNFSTTTVSTLTIRFTGSATVSGTPIDIAIYEWNFGDGTVGIGPVVDHVYAAHGTYTVTMTVMDRNGNRSVFSNVIGI